MLGFPIALWLFTLAPSEAPELEPAGGEADAAADAATEAQRDEQAALDRFAGKYRYVGGTKQHDRLRRAIDVAIEPMLDIIEGLARRKLNANLSPAGHYDFVVDGDDIRIDDRTGHPMAGRADGTRFQWKGDDGKHRASRIRFARGAVRVRVVGPHSSTRIVYRLDAAGKRLTRTTTIVDDRMPRPLTYKFSYRRIAE